MHLPVISYVHMYAWNTGTDGMKIGFVNHNKLVIAIKAPLRQPIIIILTNTLLRYFLEIVTCPLGAKISGNSGYDG